MVSVMSLTELFVSQFQGAPTFAVRSPGRVNLIGEHVDYNDGFVLPMAVPLQTDLLLRPRGDGQVILHSPLFGETRQFALDALGKQGNWVDYAQGVAAQLLGDGIPLVGFEGVVTSDIPLASGLSSSASFEVGIAMALCHLAGAQKTPSVIALLCQAAENQFIGVNCGIMDQMSVAACTADHALLLDCRRHQDGGYLMRQVPLRLKDHAIVVTDSAAPRELASSAYNERRAQCEAGLAILQGFYPEAKALRDITPAQLEEHRDALTPLVFRRVRHIISEIDRTQSAVASLEAGDLAAFGHQMNASDESLRADYEVTSAELNWLTAWSRARPGVLGSRMTGAGFGGCTVTLLEKGVADSFAQDLVPAYAAATGRRAQTWVCEAAPGAQVTVL